MARRLVLLEELVAVVGSTILRDPMYVLFQRQVWEEVDWGRMSHGRIDDVTKHLEQREDYMVELEVLGPLLLAAELHNYM
nr:hypothetical protein [Tanacetum cinerariifolium]